MTNGDQTKLKRLRRDEDKGENADMLSNLPLEILHSILADLETVVVVRTCILSKKWRNIWISMPYLNFDLLTYDDNFTTRRWFWKFVKSVLVGRNQDHIIKRLQLKFRFHFWYWERSQRLLQLAALQTIEELDICTYGEEMSFDKLSLPPHLSKLKILKVRATLDIRLQVKSNFSNLTHLYLEGIHFIDDDDDGDAEEEEEDDTISKLFLSSLEELHLENCRMKELIVLDISAPNLKKLTFVNKCSVGDRVDYSFTLLAFLGDLKLWAPSLIYFNYAGPVLRSFTLLNLSSLDNACMCLSNVSKRLNLPSIMRALHHVKKLTLSAFTLTHFVHRELACDFDMLPNLLSLVVEVKFTPRNVEGLLYLLKLSPNLQKLAIVLRKVGEYDEFLYTISRPWKLLDWDMEGLIDSLKVVKVYRFVDSAMAMEIVKQLLQHGEVLNQMQIVYKQPKILLRNYLKILLFPRASKDVTFTFF